jgi:hypothetical protein
MSLSAVRSLLLSAAVGLMVALPAGPPRPPVGAKVLTIGGPVASQAVAPGFLGLSLEYWAIPAYAGSDPSAIDAVFVQLIRNLAGGHPPALRIGGVTTDNSWWPAPGLGRPAGVTYSLTRRWIGVTRALASRLGARLILGINFEDDNSAVAAAEAKAILAGIGRRRVEALELGNEPELYGIFKWGVSGALGRPHGYDFAAFDQDFTRVAHALPNVPLAGPTNGADSWFRYLGRFLSDQPRVAVATLHRYPLQLCFVSPGQPNYPTIANLLAPNASRSLAASVAAAVRAAHAHRVSLRIDEMNTISCGDVPGVAQSFASALWALDVMFQMARVGVDGVNIHTFPGVGTSLFSFQRVRGRWRGVVEPEYYGLEMFAQAAPAGSRLLRVSPTGAPQLKAWATRAPDHTIRVVAINEGARTQVVAVRATGMKAIGTIERLQAPSIRARRDVTLAGQSFGANTATGLPAGPRRTRAVAPTAGDYVFRVPAGSAAMLTLPRS